jgi:hypothetical protein
VSILTQVPRPELVLAKYSRLSHKVFTYYQSQKSILEIVDVKRNKKDAAPVRKVNTRGVLKVDGYSDFNPDLNL